MLANEDEFLHAVTVLIVPVLAQSGILLHELLQLVFGHGGIPLSCIADADLLACLFEDIADVALVVEVADALGADDALRPLSGYELVEQAEVEGATVVIDVGADAIFFCLALVVVVMVMVLVMMLVMVCSSSSSSSSSS